MKSFKLAAVAACFVVAVASGHAQVLTLSTNTSTLEGDLVGQELVGAFPMYDAGANNGMVSTWVVNDPTLDSQGYTFIYQDVNSGIDAINNAEFTGFSSGVVIGTGTYSSLTGSLILPDAMTPDPGGNFPFENTFGGTATFENGELNNGGTPSFFLVVETNVRNFGPDYGQIQDDFTAAGNILAPVPEPPASLVFLAGLASLYCVLRIRRAVKTA